MEGDMAFQWDDLKNYFKTLRYGQAASAIDFDAQKNADAISELEWHEFGKAADKININLLGSVVTRLSRF